MVPDDGPGSQGPCSRGQCGGAVQQGAQVSLDATETAGGLDYAKTQGRDDTHQWPG